MTNLRLIAIDDDPYFLSILNICIHQIAGEENIDVQEVSCFSDPLEAEKTIQDNYYKLILLDIKMQPLDGLSWLKRMQRRKIILPPIVIFSASDLEYDIKQAFRLNVSAYMVKTGKHTKLRRKIKATLSFYDNSTFPDEWKNNYS